MYQIKIKDPIAEILHDVYDRHVSAHRKTRSRNQQISLAIEYLSEQYAAHEDEYPDLKPTPPPLSSDIDEELRRITSPDVSVPVELKHDKGTPRDLEGRVPWDYILAGYSNLDFIEEADTPEKAALVQHILSRMPEDTWESNQVSELVKRALLEPR